MNDVAQRVRAAYLVSEHPKLSHAFIAREVSALREAGAELRTFSIRPPGPTSLLTEADRREAARTTVLLAADRRPLVRAHARLLSRRPGTWWRGAVRALRTGPRTPRAAVWQLFYFAEAVLLVREMQRSGLRHVHVHLANSGADVARAAAALGQDLDGPGSWTWSLSMHGPTEFSDVTGYDLAAKVRSAAFVACITDYCRSQLMGLVEPEFWPRLRVVAMGVDLAAYAPAAAARSRRPPGPLRVLFVGRLVAEKGPSVLLDAVEMVRAGGREVELVLVGEGDLADTLSRRSPLAGPVAQDELPVLYAWADVFCLPSFAEGLPVVLMEAMCTELPVVTTRITGIPELVVDGVNGRLVTPGRADLVARALEELADDPALRRRLGEAGRAAVTAAHDAGRNAAELAVLLADPA